MTAKPRVGIVMGSDSDLPLLQETVQILERFEIPFELTVASAHRSPARIRAWVRDLEAKGAEVIIAAAGGAAHLPGVVAAETVLPVIGIPVPTLYLNGTDSLYSIVQMPAGVPVACMAIGKGGAVNAALLAAQMLALHDSGLQNRLRQYKQELAQGVEKKAAKLDQLGIAAYLETL